MMIADVAQRCGIDEAKLLRHQPGEDLFGIAQGMIPQRRHVIHPVQCQHLSFNSFSPFLDFPRLQVQRPRL